MSPPRSACAPISTPIASNCCTTLIVTMFKLNNAHFHRLQFTALCTLLFARTVFALPEDQQQPIHVTADSAVQEANTVTYRGNVIIVQGSVRIEADQVVIYHEKGKLQKAIATGKPAHFQEQPEANGGLITGNAAKLIYYNADQRVELLQDAFVDRDKSTVKGDRIEY